jgi:murein DD-endopeptidase MepM/ murein hydrolase activator NlpD
VGTPVLAAAAGKVIYADSKLRGYGKLVVIRHAGDLVTVYAHNRRLLVREGQQVRGGEVIAEVGKTGRATGYHLHFEVRRGDRPVDPLGYVTPP